MGPFKEYLTENKSKNFGNLLRALRGSGLRYKLIPADDMLGHSEYITLRSGNIEYQIQEFTNKKKFVLLKIKNGSAKIEVDSAPLTDDGAKEIVDSVSEMMGK